MVIVDDVFQEIKDLKLKLDTYHGMDPDYLPLELLELRNYIFQVHAAYENAIHWLLVKYYVKAGVTREHAEKLFAFVTFASKLELVAFLEPDFPLKSALALNSLRNTFAHKPGKHLRDRYHTDVEILRKFRSLSHYYDSLDAFLIEKGGLTKEKAAEIIAINNEKYTSRKC